MAINLRYIGIINPYNIPMALILFTITIVIIFYNKNIEIMSGKET